MFLEKIRSGESGILLYGLTPPKSDTSPEKVVDIAARTIERLTKLDLDAIVIYDVQDESARTDEERPFPFLKAMDPLLFANDYLQNLSLTKILYRPAGKFSPEELTEWLDDLHRNNWYPVFVGVPTPDFPVRTSLPDAYKIWARNKESSVIGAVAIPERHELLKDEDKRMLDKANCGVSFFISQCVFNLDYAKKLIEDLQANCTLNKLKAPTIIFTLTACGSAKTLQFLEWLGIHIPEATKAELLASEDILTRSVDICLEIARELTAFCAARSIPFGFNIESVAIRKAEIEASIHMVNTIGDILSAEGLRAKNI